MKISLQELTDLSKRALSKYGYPEEEATIILDMLMYAQMRGNDQGIVKLIGKGIPRHQKAQTPTIEKETPTTAIINANLLLFEQHRLVVEGSGALGVGGLLKHKERFKGKKVVAVVCGRNINLEVFKRIIN